tara:strand:- start:299 stop:655 length:357 start_codon:yes stop_codon:yes gene_type:complete
MSIDRRLLEHDPVRGVKKFFSIDDKGHVTIETETEFGPLMEENRQLANEPWRDNVSPKGRFHRVGRIPGEFLHWKLLQMGSSWNEFQVFWPKEDRDRFIMKILKDGDYRNFKVTSARL